MKQGIITPGTQSRIARFCGQLKLDPTEVQVNPSLEISSEENPTLDRDLLRWDVHR